jgi:hypothetical protein
MRHSPIFPILFTIYFVTLFFSIQARHHFHTKHKNYSHSHKSSSEISLPPTPLPSPYYSAPQEAPSLEPSSPFEEAPSPSPTSDENNYQNASGLFDVRKFGAIGDGITDDTESFKMAWDTACQSELALNVIFVPNGFSFIVQSSIFTGPCKGGLVLKVMYLGLYMFELTYFNLSNH